MAQSTVIDAVWQQIQRNTRRMLQERHQQVAVQYKHVMGMIRRTAAGAPASIAPPGRRDIGNVAEFNSAPNPSAIMSVDIIATTNEVDRDGDMIEPMGATVDPAMPLLLFHDPTRPVGRYVSTLVQKQNILQIRCNIANTEAGREAAALVAFGGVRCSIGFAPVEFEPLRSGGDAYSEPSGWHLTKTEIYEISLVAIPSNPGCRVYSYQWITGKEV
jgi:HK97 family phage prohead protease